MKGRTWRGRGRGLGLAAVAVVAVIAAFPMVGYSQNTNMHGADPTQTYTAGQSVVPVYGGWIAKDDGSFDLVFNYLNRNWQEEVQIPIGPDNNVSAPDGPDAGQPTYFYPRNNRWQFRVNVPADFGTKEVVWTLTSHGETLRAYATLKPAYAISEFAIQHEYASDSRPGRVQPTLKVDGLNGADIKGGYGHREQVLTARDTQVKNVKVGEPVSLVAVATDSNKPAPRRGAGVVTPDGGQANDFGGRATVAYPAVVGPGSVGGRGTRDTVAGMRFSWIVYRGDAKNVVFTPRMGFKAWEDLRGGSPWAPGWQPPQVPRDNTWRYTATFTEPGQYMLRAISHNGTHFKYEHVLVNVTR